MWLINHNCVPHTHNSCNAHSGQKTIHATRLIFSREEIMICYSVITPRRTSALRRRVRHVTTEHGSCDLQSALLQSALLLCCSVWVGDEVHLYVVPATNLSLATVDRAKRPQKLGYGTHSGYERAREQQVTRPQIRPLVTTTPCAGHHATLRVDIGPAEDLSSTQWTGHEEHQEQATEQRVFRRQQQCGAPVRVQQYGCGD